MAVTYSSLPTVRLTPEAERDQAIERLLRAGELPKKVAERLQVSLSTVYRVQRRERIPSASEIRWSKPIEDFAFRRPLLPDVDYPGRAWSIVRGPAEDPQRGRTWQQMLLP